MSYWEYLGKLGVHYNTYKTRATIETLLILIGFSIIFVLVCSLAKVKLRQKLKNNKYIVIQGPNVDIQISKLQNLFVQPGLLNHILITISTLVLSLNPPVLSSFGYINKLSCRVAMAAIFIIGFFFEILNNSLHSKPDKFHQKLKNAVINLKQTLLVESVIALIMIVVLPVFIQKGCLCYESISYGIPYLDGLYYSSEWIRSYYLNDKVCPDNSVCHIFATLPQNASSEVFINVHTGTNLTKLQIQLNTQTFNCEEQTMSDEIEEKGQRIVFSCYAQNLQSNTLYNLNLLQGDKVLLATQYKTLPSNLDQADLKIVFGGDASSMEQGQNLFNNIQTTNPDLIIVGGDVAYDNGNIHCYYSYDLFLWMLEGQFKKLGRIVPLILSVGNHDVGYNDYSDNNITLNSDAPLYFTYFPQRSVDGKIPTIFERITFNYHIMKDIIIFGLDSGYIYTHAQQVPLVSDVLSQYPNLLPFAHYHSPMYPSCLDGISLSRINQSKLEWVPLFDEFKFVGVFENHVHQFKRTFPLFNDSPASNGTIYFGDGSLGASTIECPDEDLTYREGAIYENYFDVTQNYKSTHYWVMTYYQNFTIAYQAYDQQYVEVNQSYHLIELNDRFSDL